MQQPEHLAHLAGQQVRLRELAVDPAHRGVQGHLGQPALHQLRPQVGPPVLLVLLLE
jgi:hypothetical protein